VNVFSVRGPVRLPPCSSTASSAPRARETVELFVEREDAEAFVAEVEDDDPELAVLLRVEVIEL
jgi:hypothetical protein